MNISKVQALQMSAYQNQTVVRPLRTAKRFELNHESNGARVKKSKEAYSTSDENDFKAELEHAVEALNHS